MKPYFLGIVSACALALTGCSEDPSNTTDADESASGGTNLTVTSNIMPDDAYSVCFITIPDEEATYTSMIECLTRLKVDAENDLSGRVQDSMAALKTLNSPAAEKAILSLEYSQDIFVKFREAECQRQSDFTLADPSIEQSNIERLAACEADITNWRIRQISGG